jgi:hypothetical protein
MRVPSCSASAAWASAFAAAAPRRRPPNKSSSQLAAPAIVYSCWLR